MTIQPRQEAIDQLYAQLRGQQAGSKMTGAPSIPDDRPSPPLTDDALLERALGAQNGEKFAKLWSGELNGHSSQSEADLALCCMLAFYSQDAEQLDRLFRRSGLMREKWERADYRDSTINRAIEGTTRRWQGPRAPSREAEDPEDEWTESPPASTPADEMQPLPESAAIDEDLAAEASLWLDEYMTWSQNWAPRAYRDFHEAAALFILATVAARRVKINLGLGMYTSLYIALIARTTLYTKSTVVDLAIAFLRKAGLGYLLASDDATPQAFIRSLTPAIPDNYDDLPAEQKELIRLRLGFSAQRGWFYEEWGQHLDAMMQREGVMASFRGVLRRFDDHKPDYSYETISRGIETVHRPYVTLLANATPADVEPFLQPGGKLWRDGFLARIGVVVPPDDGYNDLPFPEAALAFPPKLLRELRDWHRALGEPRVTLDPILGKGKEPTGRYRAQVTPVDDTVYSVSPDVRRAFYAYDNAMRQILSTADQHDFDGSYGRFPVKALRIAALLTSLQDVNGTKTIQLSAWYRGQAIAERWRQSLHRLVAQLQDTGTPSRAIKIEDQIIRVLKKHGPSSINDLYRWTKIPATDLTEHLKALHSVRLVRIEMTKRTTKYRYTGPTS